MAEWLALAVISLFAAGFTVWFVSKPEQRAGFSRDLLNADNPAPHVFLFDGPAVIGCSHLGDDRHILNWEELRQKLADEFPGFPQDPEAVEQQGEVVVKPIDGRTGREVFCEWVDGVVRVELRSGGKGQNALRRADPDPIRLAMDPAPYPVWHLDTDGRISWCNAAYVALARKLRNGSPDLYEPLFPEVKELGNEGKKSRISVSAFPSEVKLWFDVVVVPQQSGNLCYAVDINAVVDAEIAQRNFVQTLAKTFAQLSIGLAIFDRNRQLALFNPALIDLTNLPADFLTSRPSVSSFFDRLRNLNMMPEPKNYGGWRQEMNDLLQAASDGIYRETWSLPSGSVYSVNGRPHPDGAIAFLFEDITAEITLTRRFRSELELGQDVLDHIEDAIVVFAADGTLAFSNTSYHKLWKSDPDRSFAKVSIIDATRAWQEQCNATPLWGDIRDFVANRENRAFWEGQVRLRDGRPLNCTINPIQNGATMVVFSLTNTSERLTETTRVG
ncbi:PAS-domain containing protein [Ruegeria sp. XHP0148]|uniref:PAS-domain containing protein n=2 Tax=Ruegeria aquimaris TaxID=2984333 RepID=A0ABT3AMI9_9RHOB|nr:PAS-domain containing protein [Ruegeria sp. XHP0148]